MCVLVNNIQSGLLKIYLYMMFMMTATQSMSAHSQSHASGRETPLPRLQRAPPLCRSPWLWRRRSCGRLRCCYCCCYFIHLLWVIEHTLNRQYGVRVSVLSYQLHRRVALTRASVAARSRRSLFVAHFLSFSDSSTQWLVEY